MGRPQTLADHLVAHGGVAEKENHVLQIGSDGAEQCDVASSSGLQEVLFRDGFNAQKEKEKKKGSATR